MDEQERGGRRVDPALALLLELLTCSSSILSRAGRSSTGALLISSIQPENDHHWTSQYGESTRHSGD